MTTVHTLGSNITFEHHGSFPVLKRGVLAFFDGMHGIVPCKVHAIEREADGYIRVHVFFTATRGAWKRGEHITTHPTTVFPRECYRRRSQTITHYTVKTDDEVLAEERRRDQEAWAKHVGRLQDERDWNTESPNDNDRG